MPDSLKELRDAWVEGMGHAILKQQFQRGILPSEAGRLFGSGQPYGGGNGAATQDGFTTGYDSGTGVTTVGFVVGFSVLGEGDIVTA